MDKIKVIITGATGMVGEGVLLECLQNEKVSDVLIVNRRHYELTHPKLKELIVADFMRLEQYSNDLAGYDGCFYCAGVSSIGMKEDKYASITYDTTLHFAKTLLDLNPNMVFTFVTGRATDSTEAGKSMWARVKGKTENALARLGFRGQYNFRPGYMKGFKEQKNVRTIFKVFGFFYERLFPKDTLSLQEVGRAMINLTFNGYSKQVLEVRDIKEQAK